MTTTTITAATDWKNCKSAENYNVSREKVYRCIHVGNSGKQRPILTRAAVQLKFLIAINRAIKKINRD